MFRKVNADGDIAVIVVNADIANNCRPRSPCRRFVFSAVGNEGDVGVVGVCLHSKRLTTTLGRCHPNDPSTVSRFRNWKTGAETGAKSPTGQSSCFSGFPEASR